MEPAPAGECRQRFTRREVRELAREVHREASPLNAALWRAVADARTALRTEAQAKRDSAIHQRVESVTLDQLAKGQHIRKAGLENLRSQGVMSASDLLERGSGDLTQVPDLSSDSVEKLVRRAQELRNPRHDDIALSGSLDLWAGVDHAVGRALVFWNTVAGLNSAPSAQQVRKAALTSANLLRLSAWYRWPFVARPVRDEAYQQVTDLRNAVASRGLSQTYSDVSTRLKDLQHHRGVAVDRAYWSHNSVALLTELERFYLDHDDEAIGRVVSSRLGDIDHDLIERMNSIRLDTTLLDRKLRLYQDLGARFCLAVGSGLLGDDMGLGKTTQALAAMAHLSASAAGTRHLVVCPAALLLSWRDEAASTVPSVSFRLYKGPGRAESLSAWQASGGIIAVSYELSDQLLKQLASSGDGFTFLVVDEAHAVKEPSTARAKAVRRLSTLAARTLLMTGTPLVNTANDMINLMRIVDTSLAEHLQERYGKTDDVLRDAAEFRSAISSRYLRRKQADVLAELPPLTLVDVPVELGNGEVLDYKEAVRTGHLSTMRIAAASSPSKLAALREIADEAKIASRKMLVFSEYLEVLDAAAAVIGSGAQVVSGAVSERETSLREASFKAADGFSALVYQIKKGGVGKNFQQASVVVLCEPQYTPAAERQAVARAHRMGQTRGVVCYRLIARGTVDERLVEIINLKTQLINGLSHDSDLDAELQELGTGAIDLGEVVRQERYRFGFT